MFTYNAHKATIYLSDKDIWWSRRLLTDSLPKRAGGRVHIWVATVLMILRFSSLGHLARIAWNSALSCSSCSWLTVLSTYQNQSFPSSDCGICTAHRENYRFVVRKCMIQKRWPLYILVYIYIYQQRLSQHNLLLKYYYNFMVQRKMELELSIPCYYIVLPCYQKSMPWAC